MKHWGVLCLALWAWASQASTEMATITFTNWAGKPESLEMRIAKPTDTGGAEKKAAVVILHHGGGWDAQTTRQYAQLLNGQGYITAEPVMFRSRLLPPHLNVPKVYATLRHLASMPDVDPQRIAVMGMSAGAFQSIFAVTQWAQQQYGQGQQFAAAVALYPACWIIKKLYQNDLGRFKNPNFPDDFLDRFTGVPLTIVAAGQDDYDGKKPTMCAEAVALMPDARQRARTQVHVLEKATHGWDHGQTYTFFEPMACEGRGCNNTNQSDPAATQAGKDLLLQALREPLKAP